jgi:predicted DNA-binding transcriptional regulator AlpA
MSKIRLSPKVPLKRVDSKLLVGWKNVANYLGMGVRTIQRYEREHALPVRRPAGGLRGAVIATSAELDAWVAASPIRDYFQLTSPKAPSSTFAEIQAGMRKMQDLCAEIRRMREEMKASMDTLHSTIHGTVRARTLIGDSLERVQGKMPVSARRPN